MSFATSIRSARKATIQTPGHVSKRVKQSEALDKSSIAELSAALIAEMKDQEKPAKAPWERFDSLTMKKTGDNTFKVDVQYLSKAGKIQRHTFEGTLDEIHKAIEGEKDLPDDEKQDLLDSLDLPDGLPAEFRELVPLMRNFEKWPGRF